VTATRIFGSAKVTFLRVENRILRGLFFLGNLNVSGMNSFDADVGVAPEVTVVERENSFDFVHAHCGN